MDQIKLTNMYSGPRGNFPAGQKMAVVEAPRAGHAEVTRHEAAELVAGRYADVVKATPAAAAVAAAPGAPETATASAAESATRRRSRNPLGAAKRS